MTNDTEDKTEKLIKDLYNTLKNYYDYVRNLEDLIFTWDEVEEEQDYNNNIPKVEEVVFTRKDCKLLLSEVEDYLREED